MMTPTSRLPVMTCIGRDKRKRLSKDCKSYSVLNILIQDDRFRKMNRNKMSNGKVFQNRISTISHETRGTLPGAPPFLKILVMN